jgi:hypothetical protein
LHLREQVQGVGFVNCTEQIFSSFHESEEVQKDASKGIVNVASQSMHGIMGRGGFDWIQSHKIVDEMVAKLTDDVEKGTRAGFSIHWIIGQNPEK